MYDFFCLFSLDGALALPSETTKWIAFRMGNFLEKPNTTN